MTASTLPATPSHHRRIVQIDGLRTIAVLAVFAQHALKAPLLWSLHYNRIVTAALALPLRYGRASWFGFERRLIHGSATRDQQPDAALHATREASRTSA